MCISGCRILYEEHRDLIISYIVCISFIVVMYFGGVDKKINKKYYLFDPVPRSENLVDIFSFNYAGMNPKTDVFNNDQLTMIWFIYQHRQEFTDDKGEIPMAGNYLQLMWAYTLTGIWPIYNEPVNQGHFYDKNTFDFASWQKDSGSKYLVLFSTAESNYDLSSYKVVYQNAYGEIISK
jgi:hypothetical protein